MDRPASRHSGEPCRGLVGSRVDGQTAVLTSFAEKTGWRQISGPDQGLGVLAIGEKDLEEAIAQQGNANDGEEQPDILPEQRPTTSIGSSSPSGY
jgi:hypothetical protein